MAEVKAHIVLDPSIGQNPEKRTALLEKLLKTAPISEINQKRLDLYGIITGMVDESLLDDIRKTPGVVSVERDKERFLR